MSPDRKRKWIVAAVVALVMIALSTLFSNLSKLNGIASDFIGIISSVLFGFAFAYVMNPVMVFVEKRLYRFLGRREISDRTAKRVSRGVGIVISLIVLIASVYALVVLIFPQLIDSLQKLLSPENMESYRVTVDKWITKILSGTKLENAYRENSDEIFNSVQSWLTNTILNESVLVNAAQWAYSAVMLVINALIGIVVAIYVLAYKDTFQAQAKKLTVAMFKEERANRIIETARRSNKIVNGFLVGKLIDSVIVGVICYIGMLLMKMPYPELISVIIGVTNIIPFFGPLLGMIPSALIILVEDPLTAFYFLIFVLALQQVDGNIIGPRILGETVGISDFWVLVSITVFGGLFGFVGMIIGVPVFAVIYMLISDAVNRALARKNHPLETARYYDISAVSDLHPQREQELDTPAYEPGYDTEFDPDDDLEIDDIDME